MGNEISNGGIKIGRYSEEGDVNNSQIIGNEISNEGITLSSNNSQVIGNEISGLGGQSYGLDLQGACFNVIKDNTPIEHERHPRIIFTKENVLVYRADLHQRTRSICHH